MVVSSGGCVTYQRGWRQDLPSCCSAGGRTCRTGSYFSGRRVSLAPDGFSLPFPLKGLLLTAHLLLSRESFATSRPELSALLWESADTAHAALNFRQLASRIRARQSELGIELLALKGGLVKVVPEVVSIDVLRFQRLVAISSPANVPELCILYGGDLLQGVEIEGEDCRIRIEAHRTRLRHLFIEEVCRHLGAPAVLDSSAAAGAAECVLEVDPYNERALRALMLALGRVNRPSLAREAYDRFAMRLRRDLGVVSQRSRLPIRPGAGLWRDDPRRRPEALRRAKPRRSRSGALAAT